MRTKIVKRHVEETAEGAEVRLRLTRGDSLRAAEREEARHSR